MVIVAALEFIISCRRVMNIDILIFLFSILIRWEAVPISYQESKIKSLFINFYTSFVSEEGTTRLN